MSSNASSDELIKTDGSITTDTTVTAAIGDKLPSGIGTSGGGGEQQKPTDRANSDSNNSQGHWDPSTNTYTSSNGYSY